MNTTSSNSPWSVRLIVGIHFVFRYLKKERANNGSTIEKLFIALYYRPENLYFTSLNCFWSDMNLVGVSIHLFTFDIQNSFKFIRIKQLVILKLLFAKFTESSTKILFKISSNFSDTMISSRFIYVKAS